jgi:hypothetical protein
MGSELRRLSTSVSPRMAATVPVWRGCRPIATTTRTRSPAARGAVCCATIAVAGANERSAATAVISVKRRGGLRFGGQPNVGGGGRPSLERQRANVDSRSASLLPTLSAGSYAAIYRGNRVYPLARQYVDGRAPRDFRLQSTLIPPVRLTTAAVIAVDRSDARSTAVSATSAPLGSRFCKVMPFIMSEVATSLSWSGPGDRARAAEARR